MRRRLLFSFLLFPLLGQSETLICADTSIVSLQFIGEYTVQHNLSFKGTTVGGLSGIDYDNANNIYYLICDDRSKINPARFYTAKIHFTQKRIDSVQFVDVKFLHQSSGLVYPSPLEDKALSPDLESIRYNAKLKRLVWTSEGERIVKTGSPILTNPSINIVSIDGKYIGSVPVPKNLIMQAIEKGPRQNGTFEGTTFADGFSTMYVSMEEPLYEDGPRADVEKTDSWTRFYRFDFSTKQNVAQYAYPLEQVAYPAIPFSGFKVNGVSEILSIGKNKLLTVERSFSFGRLGCTIKVFEADLLDADNIMNVQSLKEKRPVHPIKKRLLLNMNDLGIYIDNVEGVTFGPDLPNGNKTLIFITDNNFMPFEKTQFLLFEVKKRNDR